jgi:SAM-dependent methyltransferase
VTSAGVLAYFKKHGTRRFLRHAHNQILVRVMAAVGRRFLPEDDDPFHRNFRDFVERINRLDRPNILEIGSREVSGPATSRGHFTARGAYVGFDFHPGPNVDVVGDVHTLSRHLASNNFDAVFCISVFEHLAMPWKVAVEINRVMRAGGLLFLSTHPTWPRHELPWDFWRFGSEAFRVLFNKWTGFELIACDEGLPCSIVPHASADNAVTLEPANLGVSLIARKTGEPDPDLRWDLSLEAMLANTYPSPR